MVALVSVSEVGIDDTSENHFGRERRISRDCLVST